MSCCGQRGESSGLILVNIPCSENSHPPTPCHWRISSQTHPASSRLVSKVYRLSLYNFLFAKLFTVSLEIKWHCKLLC